MPDLGTILVVDDTPSKRYVLSSWLRRAGFTIVEAATGGEALAQITAQGSTSGSGPEPAPSIDAVVLDVQLPDMTGFEVCERIKDDPAHAATPVVHVSAAAVDVMDRTQGLSRGADAYLVEPIDPNELIATVQAVLRYYRARQHAERLATRLSKLASMAVTLNTAATLPQLLREAVIGTADIFDGPAVICTELSDGAQVCWAISDSGSEPRITDWLTDAFQVPVGSVYHSQPTSMWPQVNWPAGSSLRVIGARTRVDRPPLYVAVPESLTDDGAPVLTQVGQTVIAAIEAHRAYAQEHQLALTLQRSLLPSTLPRIDGYQIAVRYVPASESAEIGGDFYEVCQLADRLIVAVGDVEGHSLQAATVMAEVRHAARAFLSEGHPPAVVLDRLNAMLLQMIPDKTVTMALLAIDLGSGVVDLANAGHPPLLHVRPDGARYVRHRTPLLGIAAPPATSTTVRIEHGDVLVMFTDGLVERRERAIGDGLSILASAATEVDADLGRFCDRLLADVAPTHPDDDLAIVAIRRI